MFLEFLFRVKSKNLVIRDTCTPGNAHMYVHFFVKKATHHQPTINQSNNLSTTCIHVLRVHVT